MGKTFSEGVRMFSPFAPWEIVVLRILAWGTVVFGAVGILGTLSCVGMLFVIFRGGSNESL